MPKGRDSRNPATAPEEDRLGPARPVSAELTGAKGKRRKEAKGKGSPLAPFRRSPFAFRPISVHHANAPVEGGKPHPNGPCPGALHGEAEVGTAARLEPRAEPDHAVTIWPMPSRTGLHLQPARCHVDLTFEILVGLGELLLELECCAVAVGCRVWR
jgi:hypothetical protein